MKRDRTPPVAKTTLRCAVYTRKSTSEGLGQEFNSLDAQREAGEAFIVSQRQEGWELNPERYDDGGFSGGDTDRPALRRLLADIEAGKIDCVVVQRVDRFSRSLRDFLALMEEFEKHGIMFVSVTQAFNTATSMGRLMLNVLLSFAQFEREMISERTRDKMAAARRKGLWLGGRPVFGFDVVETRLVINEDEAARVRQIFTLYLELGGLLPVVQELARRGWNNKVSITKGGRQLGGKAFTKTSLHRLLTNVTYIGKAQYQNEVHDGKHEAILDSETWRRTQAQLAQNGRQGGAGVRNKFGALLKGILDCGSCHCSMSPTHSTKNGRVRYRYYKCQRSQQNGHGACPHPTVCAEPIERLVVEQIRGIGRNPEVLAATLEVLRGQSKSEIANLEVERRQLQRNLSRWNTDSRGLLVDAQSDDSDSPAVAQLAELQERIRSGRSRASEVDQQLEALLRCTTDRQSVARSLSDFDPVWEALTPRERTQLVQLLVERVTFNGSTGKVSIKFCPLSANALSARQPEDAA